MENRAVFIDTVTCREEQSWNAAQLGETVTEPRLRLWTYRAPGVVLGCSQGALRERLDGGHALAASIVQRGSGGGAVLTGPWMVSASIVLPPEHPLLGRGTLSSYRWLGALHAGLLRDVGIAAHAVPPEEARLRQADARLKWACYGGLSPWEVVVGRRKIVGLAQLRRRTGVLLTSGTLIAPPDWPLLCDALGQAATDAALLDDSTTSFAEQLGAPILAEVLAERLHHMLTDVLGTATAPATAPAIPRAPAQAPRHLSMPH
ncbi:lipoate--protein ligase family protein [Pseudoduganella umbonata]|uniref:Lipoate-protein ligase A n=1 Tax=Pseudoduganella umbonata TaxID=864828 RepID=A0A7W5ECJ1_9BURK|nr:lipoate--protein ligase [Pseudoduganella umbonata]MBB3222636.1 lipoate-protein ligase A [Pseudoduganella umbonata]